MSIKIVDLTQAPSIQGNDILPISQEVAGVRNTKKVSFSQISTFLNYIPKPSTSSCVNGDVLTYDRTTQTWKPSASQGGGGGTGGGSYILKPSSAIDKQILTYDNDIAAWAPKSLSSIGDSLYIRKPLTYSDGQVLTYSNNTNGWIASAIPVSAITEGFIPKPLAPEDKQILTYNGVASAWEAVDVAAGGDYIQNPILTPTINDALIWNGSMWLGSPYTESQVLPAFSNNLLSANGYQMIPGGLLLQWGTLTATNSGVWQDPQVVLFPIMFPNNVWYVGLSPDGADNVGVEFAQMDWTTEEKTTLSSFGIYTSNFSVTGIVKYFAIGN